MTLQVDQELRRDLLLKALDACSDPEEALELAVRMECFILEGQTSGKNKRESVTPETNRAPQRLGKKKAHARPRWTPDDDEKLRRLWQENNTVEAVAEQLHRTTASIYGRARQLVLPPNKGVQTKTSRKAENAGSAA